jgi:hypothetical protein
MEQLRVFYLERDFYSNPQVVVVTAENRDQADIILNEQLKKENYQPGEFEELTELDLTKPGIIILQLPDSRPFDDH